jgi:GrpB-like predicted nucleotidyltransferase (UPF0157 family)
MRWMDTRQPCQRARVETLRQKVEQVLQERIELVAYDPRWPARFAQEKKPLLDLFPHGRSAPSLTP